MTIEHGGCKPGNGDDTGCSIPADPDLVAQGWERRHLADPDRADEAVQLYSSLGFEVRTQKLTPADFGPDCGQCAAVVCKTYVLIYTRKSQ